MQKLFSICLVKISEFWRYIDGCTDTSGGLLPTRQAKPEGNTPLLCLNSLNYVWYVLVCYTNTSWPSVCHKIFSNTDLCQDTFHFSNTPEPFQWNRVGEQQKVSKAKGTCQPMYVHNMSELLSPWSSTKDHGSPQLLHTCQNNDTKLRFLLL